MNDTLSSTRSSPALVYVAAIGAVLLGLAAMSSLPASLLTLTDGAAVADVPLPEGSTIVHMGENSEIPFHPQWEFSLQPDKTVELLVGWFVLPLSFDDAIAWYQAEMAKCGWVDGPKEGYRMPRQALLRFQKPEARIRVELGIQWWPYRQETTAMIRRVVEHPWLPAEGESAGEPVSELTRVNGRDLPAYTRPLASTGVRRRQLDETAQVEEEPERGEELQVAV